MLDIVLAVSMVVDVWQGYGDVLFCIIKLIYQYRPVARKFYWGVLLKEMWTFSYCSHSANHSPGVVDELIFYGVCIAHIHEGL